MRHCGRSRGAAGRLAPLAPGERGLTIVDLVMALAVIVLLGGLVMPATATVIDASRARHAAGFMATHFRLARLQALARTRTVGLVFDLVNGQWTFRVCSDGNGNGLRRADLAAGWGAMSAWSPSVPRASSWRGRRAWRPAGRSIWCCLPEPTRLRQSSNRRWSGPGMSSVSARPVLSTVAFGGGALGRRPEERSAAGTTRGAMRRRRDDA